MLEDQDHTERIELAISLEQSRPHGLALRIVLVRAVHHFLVRAHTTPGLLWKVWLISEKEKEAGGIYLFESADAARAYVSGPIVASLKASPAVSNISAKMFDVLPEHTAITRGPLTAAFETAG